MLRAIHNRESEGEFCTTNRPPWDFSVRPPLIPALPLPMLNIRTNGTNRHARKDRIRRSQRLPAPRGPTAQKSPYAHGRSGPELWRRRAFSIEPHKNHSFTRSFTGGKKRCSMFSMAYKLPRVPVRSMFFCFNQLQTPGGGGWRYAASKAKSVAFRSSLLEVGGWMPQVGGWKYDGRPIGASMIPLKPGTKPWKRAHFLTDFRVFATRSARSAAQGCTLLALKVRPTCA